MTVVDRVTVRLWTAFTAGIAGVSSALAIEGPPDIEGLPSGEGDLKNTVVNIIKFVLDFLALIAVIFIIVAGIRLIISQGEEEQKEKAKKSIIYVIIGLVIVLLARVIVGFFTSDQFTGLFG